jgi:Cactus-binding C-terminus of cactin protein/Conserved mid region of cactin
MMATKSTEDRKCRDKSSDSSQDTSHRREERKKRKKKKEKSKKRRQDNDSSSSDSDSCKFVRKRVVNKKLLEKLENRGETLEEREERRLARRAARIEEKFGYTAENNPFHDPNLHEPFSWNKKKENQKNEKLPSRTNLQTQTFEEIEKVRKRRLDRESQLEEMERLRAEESRMKELENYDDWARKEEEFHLQQQRQRSAIRLVEGREKPIDVLAKNLLMFGLSEEERNNRAKVKYQERYNALSELDSLEAELQKPQELLTVLKLEELEELARDVDAYRRLEYEGSQEAKDSTVLQYWNNLHCVVLDEIEYLKNGGDNGAHASLLKEVQSLFRGQSFEDLQKTRMEFEDKARIAAHKAAYDLGARGDIEYWQLVLNQLKVYTAKQTLTELHHRMLVRQLERLEKKKLELEAAENLDDEIDVKAESNDHALTEPKRVNQDLADLEEELGLKDEVCLDGTMYGWQDKWLPRKPRYFHRVKSGYDWNSYNRTHYDTDNPPPKTVQGYRFNVFYPDLIDKTKTPQYFLEKADSDDFCIIRFSGGPPYEDIAFKIINREWNRSRKHGFCSKFERGVLTLYFNFTTHWYRR